MFQSLRKKMKEREAARQRARVLHITNKISDPRARAEAYAFSARNTIR